MSQTAKSRRDRLVRLDPHTGSFPAVPQDDYAPVWNYVPGLQSADDSAAMGHWVWRKVFVGYVGRTTGVMLGPEWADLLEAIPTDLNRP